MKRFPSLPAVLLFLTTLAAATAHAQSATHTAPPVLHVNDSYSSCFFDLHPELTQAEFDDFASELGSIMRFRQLGDSTPLPRGRFEVSFDYASTAIDESRGAWNNTMSHPAADHYLGQSIAFPRVVARFGLSNRADLGVWGSVNPSSNYGLIGADTRIALLRESSGRPVTVSVRPSITSLVGPSEVWVGNAAIDLSVSRRFGALSPYVGVATSASVAVERSNDVALDPATASGGVVYVGTSYRWRAVVVAAEVEKAALVSYGFRIGTVF